MRLLFLHVARENSIEYHKHRRLAQFADRTEIDPYFIWQRAAKPLPQDSEVNWAQRSDRNFHYEFGRDISLSLTRWQRAALMAVNLPKGFLQIERHIKELKPDALYTSQQGLDTALGEHFSRRYRIPHIIHISYPIGPWLGARTLQRIHRSSCLIAVSNFIRNTAIAQGIAPENIHTIHNPADLTKFDVTPDPEPLRKEFGFPPEAFIITAAGRLDPSKGFLTLIEAFALLHRDFPQARVLVCGQTFTRDKYDEVLKRRTKELGLSDKLIFAGMRKDMLRVYAGSDVFCLPTKEEAFGFVFTEAMTAGLPVVAADSGGVPEIVTQGESGFLAPSDDALATAACLRKFLEDPALARRMGAEGKRSVAERFAPEIISPRWQRLVLDMTAPGR